MNEGTATITAAIKKPEISIERLLGEYNAQPVETAGTVEFAEGRNEYTPLLAKLEEYLNNSAVGDLWTITNPLHDILAPEQINQFLQTTLTLENHPEYLERTGRFISRLIQNSYDAGHNDFELDLRNLKEIHKLGSYLVGAEENPIRITIKEKTGNCCGWNSDYIILNTQETGCSYGCYSTHSSFTAQKTGEYCGEKAQLSTFKTPQRKTFIEMLGMVAPFNKVVLIREDGSEQVVDI